MQNQEAGKRQQKQHKSFRLSTESISQLEEVSALFNDSQAVMLEKMIAAYHKDRIDYFNKEVANRLKSAGND